MKVLLIHRMEKVAIEDVEAVPHFMGANQHRKPLSRAIEAMDFAVSYLELQPGESFSGGLHTHTDQQELFVVLEGTATWETKGGPEGEDRRLEVGPHEAIHFESSDAFQQGRNESDGVVRGLAIGVPGSRHRWEGVEALVDCPDCGRETVFGVVPDDPDGRMPDAEATRFVCSECGHEL